jgi:hypothetical protein
MWDADVECWWQPSLVLVTLRGLRRTGKATYVNLPSLLNIDPVLAPESFLKA